MSVISKDKEGEGTTRRRKGDAVKSTNNSRKTLGLEKGSRRDISIVTDDNESEIYQGKS